MDTHKDFDSFIQETIKHIKKTDMHLAKKHLEGLRVAADNSPLNMIAYEDLATNKM